MGRLTNYLFVFVTLYTTFVLADDEIFFVGTLKEVKGDHAIISIIRGGCKTIKININSLDNALRHKILSVQGRRVVFAFDKNPCSSDGYKAKILDIRGVEP